MLNYYVVWKMEILPGLITSCIVTKVLLFLLGNHSMIHLRDIPKLTSQSDFDFVSFTSFD